MKFTQIPVDTFEKLQINAGVLANKFDIETEEIEGLVGATKGGVTIAAKPTFSDYGEDIDNCPKNMLELKRLDSWEATMSGTLLTVDAEGAKDLTAAADIEKLYKKTADETMSEGKTYYTLSDDGVYEKFEGDAFDPDTDYYEFLVSKVQPRQDLTVEDFKDKWWIGDYGNKDGSYVAVHILNALSSDGFQIKTTDKAKGEFAFNYTGHYSMAAQTKPPFEIYIKQ